MKIEYFGASHKEGVGALIKGFPAGIVIDGDKLSDMMKRRSPSKAFESSRREEDEVVFESGISDGKTDGNDIKLFIRNKNVRPSDYDDLKNKPRPSHADFTAMAKYGNDYDMRGGGEFSGRMTAAITAAGALCEMYLDTFGIAVYSRVYSIKNIKDIKVDYTKNDALVGVNTKEIPTVSDEKGMEMLEVIEEAKLDGDSVGGVAECFICNVPAGVGSPHTDSLESLISKHVFAVPSVKGIEFGSGFSGTELFGSENNDPFEIDNGKIVTSKNDHGGILGGISSGMPIVFRVAMKPIPSISKEQRTVDLSSGEECIIRIKGRHDSCAVIRALVVIEASAAIALTEALLNEK